MPNQIKYIKHEEDSICNLINSLKRLNLIPKSRNGRVEIVFQISGLTFFMGFNLTAFGISAGIK